MKSILITLFGFLGFGNAAALQAPASEPLFKNINNEDAEIKQAHSLAAQTINKFIILVKEQTDATYMAKLRFRDPDLSEKLGKDQFVYIWLTDVVYHREESMLSGVFFEVPDELKKWHHVGQRLGFEADDAFDWMVNDKGNVKGAYTIRVTRSRLKTESEKLAYDEYVGITAYENLK